MVEEVGPRRDQPARSGDRVIVPFPIACGNCFFCDHESVVLLRQLEPERLDGREAATATRRRAVRLLAHDGRLRRRAGGVRSACRSPTSVRSRCPTR